MEMDRWMDRKTDGTDEPTSHASHETARSSASLTEYVAQAPPGGTDIEPFRAMLVMLR